MSVYYYVCVYVHIVSLASVVYDFVVFVWILLSSLWFECPFWWAHLGHGTGAVPNLSFNRLSVLCVFSLLCVVARADEEEEDGSTAV